ncbi:hypothetical protein KKB44_05320 [Candidatus Micrarchaeota archaeon]|nr:hypothetical protein [Candidatus Micrarchaeota archaeon]
MREHKIKRQEETISLEKARIIARLMGDGAVYLHKHDYIMKYGVKDKESLQSFAKDMKTVYGLKAAIGESRSGKGSMVPYARIRSKLAYEDLLRYGPYDSRSWRVPAKIFKANSKVKAGFLKAFFTDEGTVVGKYVRLYSINKEGLKGVARLLKEFGIRSVLRPGFGARRNVYALIISKEKNIQLFSEMIGFYLKRKNKKLKELLTSSAKVCSVS